MASELDLTTLAEVRSWLGFKAANVENDADLERLITACSTTIQKLIGRNVLSAAYNHFQDGNGAPFMVLRYSPIVRVANVLIDGRPVDPAQVSFEGATLYLSGGLRFNRGRHNIQLRYTAGHDEVPADLAQVCVETVGLRWRERDRIGMTSKSLGGETTAFSLSDFSPTARTVISAYARVAPV